MQDIDPNFVIEDDFLIHQPTGNKIKVGRDDLSRRAAHGLLARPRYYTGKAPEQCEMLGDTIEGVFYDCATTMGPWANVGPRYFEQGQCRLGTGLGQKYELQENGRWLKTGG